MATSTHSSVELEAVARRARRNRLRTEPIPRFDRFGIGLVAAVVIDLTVLGSLLSAHDTPGLIGLLLGPFMIAASPWTWAAIAAAVILAACARHWRLVAGIATTQLGLLVATFVWPMLLAGGRWLPL